MHWLVVIMAGKSLAFSSHEVNVWLGPSYAYNEATRYEGVTCSAEKRESIDNFGVSAGADFLFFDRIDFFAHVLEISL